MIIIAVMKLSIRITLKKSRETELGDG